jgi:hypothetical protein
MNLSFLLSRTKGKEEKPDPKKKEGVKNAEEHGRGFLDLNTR